MAAHVKNYTVTFCFIFLLIGSMLANILIPDRELSHSERRRLRSLPAFSRERLLDGRLFLELEKYFLDQFVLRDEFRSLKALSRLYVFRQKDNNLIYLVGDGIYKMEFPLNERSIYNAAGKFNEIYNLYLEGKKIYYAVIPDKNYFVAGPKGYLTLDYERMMKILKENMSEMEYIDLFQHLSIEDYYRTDLHWRQDRILHVAEILLARMGAAPELREEYARRVLYPFYGSYYGQSALPIKPDNLIYLTNRIIENARVYDHQTKTYGRIYAPDLFQGIDSYDLYLSGARPLLTIENPGADGGRELIIFRDSFGSSIAPLMLEGYAKITLVDLRYISTRLLGDYIDFSGDQDVLFLYSTQILNNSRMLR